MLCFYYCLLTTRLLLALLLIVAWLFLVGLLFDIGLLYSELAFEIMGHEWGKLGNYNVSGNLGNKLVLGGGFIINKGN